MRVASGGDGHGPRPDPQVANLCRIGPTAEPIGSLLAVSTGVAPASASLAKAWPRAALISRKSPKRFKLGFKTVTRPLVRHSSHVLARAAAQRSAVRLRRLARKNQRAI